MIDSIPSSTKEHWDVLWILLAAAGTILYSELRWFLRGLKKALDESIRSHNECQVNLPKEYISKLEFEKLEKDRAKRWDKYFFPHTHYPEAEGGGVKIPRNILPEKD